MPNKVVDYHTGVRDILIIKNAFCWSANNLWPNFLRNLVDLDRNFLFCSHRGMLLAYEYGRARSLRLDACPWILANWMLLVKNYLLLFLRVFKTQQDLQFMDRIIALSNHLRFNRFTGLASFRNDARLYLYHFSCPFWHRPISFRFLELVSVVLRRNFKVFMLFGIFLLVVSLWLQIILLQHLVIVDLIHFYLVERP